MQDFGRALAESAQKGQHAQIVAVSSGLLQATYDSGTAYLNVVTLGGYAAFFGLWSLLGNDIPLKLKFWSGLLIGVSVLLFVGFEIIKAAVLHWQLRKLLQASKTPPQTPLQVLHERQAAWDSAQQTTVKVVVGIWCVVFPVTILTGMGGALVLLYAFALKLWTIS
jgi:hypothetical protein